MHAYESPGPSREEVDAMAGTVLLEFGTNWCGHCQAAEPFIKTALEKYPEIRHLKVEDGPGRPLGRSYRVKLWPTLIALRDGVEVARVVRPTSVAGVQGALAQVAKG